MPREKLLELCSLYAKNWLATDGLWFQGVERHFGFDKALKIDIEMWEQFTVIEATRVKEFLMLTEFPGLEGLKQALQFRLYAPLNKAETYYDSDGALIYRVVTCRVQYARERKNMEYHTCKPVGIVEYSRFAETIDPRIKTQVISCHPDVTDPTCNCMWKFTLEE